MKKVYWVQAMLLTVRLCHYLQKHKLQLPTDLRAPAQTALDAVTVFCDLLVAYDEANARGKGVI